MTVKTINPIPYFSLAAVRSSEHYFPNLELGVSHDGGMSRETLFSPSSQGTTQLGREADSLLKLLVPYEYLLKTNQFFSGTSEDQYSPSLIQDILSIDEGFLADLLEALKPHLNLAPLKRIV